MLRQKLKEKFKGTFAKPYGSPEEILIIASSIEEVLNQPFYNFQRKLKAIEELDKLINNFIWLGKVKPREGDRHVSFIAQADIEGEKCFLLSTKELLLSFIASQMETSKNS